LAKDILQNKKVSSLDNIIILLPQSSNLLLSISMRTIVLTVTLFSACFMQEVNGAVFRTDAKQEPASLVKKASVVHEKKKQPAGFDKNFPVDERPKADTLTFNHPYPVVQDSDDFDKDFVKDQNTDNGEYEAQMKYDKVRHMLTKLKQVAADKLAQKQKDEQDIAKHAKQAEDEHAKDERTIAVTSKEIPKPVVAKEPVEPVQPKKPVFEAAKPVVEAAKVVDSKVPATATPKVAAKVVQDAPAVVATPTAVAGIGAATQDVAKAKADMEKCRKELDDAKAALKIGMDDLAKAKVAKIAAEKKLEQTEGPLAEAKKQETIASEKVTAEKKEQQAAEAAYLKQQKKVEAMHLKLDIAAKKVKQMRDSEDKNGGVYNTDKEGNPVKLAEGAAKSQLLGVAALIAAAFVHMA